MSPLHAGWFLDWDRKGSLFVGGVLGFGPLVLSLAYAAGYLLLLRFIFVVFGYRPAAVAVKGTV